MEPLLDDQVLNNSTIYSLYFSEDQTLWISTPGGVAAYQNGQLTIYQQGAALPSTPVKSIAEQNGAIYFSHPQGISRYYDGQWTHYGSRDGVSSLKGRLILDDRGTMWGLGQEGVFGFTPSSSP